MQPNRRRLLAAAALIAPALVLLAATAQAHGNVSDPPSRNYRCYQVWGQSNYNPARMQAEDPMCAQAWAGSDGAMYNWNGNLRDGLAGNYEAALPDGTLCSVGHAFDGRYDVLDVPGPWIATPLPHDFTLNLRDDSAHGADYLRIYVSRQGYDPTTAPLRWSDLTLLEETGRYAPANNYRAAVSVPANLTGHHVLFTIWKASHADQAYFLCSDVSFGDSGTTTTTTPRTTTTTSRPTTTTTALTTTTTATTTSTTTTTASTATTRSTTSASGSAGCSASYRVVSQWGSGFQAEVTVSAGAAALRSWTVSWSLAGGEGVSQSWGADVNVTGGTVRATSLTWNGNLNAGAATSFGFIGSGPGGSVPVLSCTAS